MRHDLKIWPIFFEAVLSCEMAFQARENDRDFKVGDTLHLQEFNPVNQAFTGRTVDREVTFIMKGGRFGIAENYVVMSMLPCL